MITVYAAQLAIEDFGRTVLGRPIELLFADDQNNADIGTAIARKWLDEDGASAMISNSFSPLGLSVETDVSGPAEAVSYGIDLELRIHASPNARR